MDLRGMHRKPQGGISLVELLVCLGLALTLSLAAVAAAISSRASLSSQDESSRMVESGLYALSVIDRAVRQAGFEHWNGTQEHGDDSLSPWVLGLDNASLPATSVALSGATAPGLNGSDVLALRHVGSGRIAADGSVLNCAGAAVAEPAAGDLENGRGWSIFHLARTDLAEPELRCKYRSEDGLKWDSQAVASGIEAMQVLYGVDQDGDGLPERYLRASAMADDKAWRSVVSLRVSLLVRSSQFQADVPGNRVHDLFLGAYATQAGQQDTGVRFDENKLAAGERQRLRRVFALTMVLRNRGPAEGSATGKGATSASDNPGSASDGNSGGHSSGNPGGAAGASQAGSGAAGSAI